MSYPTYVPVLGNELAEEIEDEIGRARAKFPKNRHLTVALLEEAGELAKSQLQRATKAEIRKEAIQVIAMAVRIIQEGDADLAKLTDEESQR